MIALRAEEQDYFRPMTPLDVCLSVWLDWQRRNDLRLGWRGRSAMMESEGSDESQQLYDSLDNQAAEAVEAMINSLPRHLDCAIRTRCGVARVWRFPNMDFPVTVVEAERELEKKLRNNIATRSFFL